MANWTNVDYDDVNNASVSNNVLYSGNVIIFTKCFHNCLILAFFLNEMRAAQRSEMSHRSYKFLVAEMVLESSLVTFFPNKCHSSSTC